MSYSPIEQIDHSMSWTACLVSRQGMKKPMAESSYEEQVASYLEGWGHLSGEVTAKHAAYVTQAKEWGMTSSRCAKNVLFKETGR